jgi:hypothetical protein
VQVTLSRAEYEQSWPNFSFIASPNPATLTVLRIR